MIGVMGIVIEAAEDSEPASEDRLGGDSTTCQRSNGWTHASINNIIS